VTIRPVDSPADSLVTGAPTTLSVPADPGGPPASGGAGASGEPAAAAAPTAVDVRKVLAERPQDVADVVIGLGRSVRDEHDLLQLLQEVVDLAARMIDGVSSAGVTAQIHGRPFTAVHTDERTLVVDAHQYEADDGPCLHAMRTGQVVEVDVSASRERWPGFTADAEDAGIRSFLAAPLGHAEPRLGALNLYSREPDGFGYPDAQLLQVLTDHASRAIGDYARLSSAELLAEQLRAALVSRAPIEQAKGILMALHGIDDAAAFELLRSESQRCNVTLHDAAVEFLRAYTGAA
jgi:transcriptional regulator with GAF, ATPase, and Fis domain